MSAQTETTDGNSAIAIDRDLISAVEQFYYREARYLDDRQFQQWMLLLSEDLSYTIPLRHSPQRDPSQRGTEAFLSVDAELSQGLEPPHREDNYFTIALRVDRSFKANSWSENPPARTRRFITNVELEPGELKDELKTYSNFLCTYSRQGRDNFTYTGQRRDTLRPADNSFKIKSREVIIDWNVVTAPSLGIYF